MDLAHVLPRVAAMFHPPLPNPIDAATALWILRYVSMRSDDYVELQRFCDGQRGLPREPRYNRCNHCRHYFSDGDDWSCDIGICEGCCTEENHYECNSCGMHRERNSNDCCDECESCCECDDDREQQDHHVDASGRTWPQPGHRMAGVEVEFNRCSNFYYIEEWCQKWGAGVHPDGSCGSEAVTSPAAGANLEAQLKTLFTAFQKAKASANNNCGIHVHVDARDLKWDGIYRLARVYSAVEPALYILGGQERAENDYCRPWGDVLRRVLDEEDQKGSFLAAVYYAPRDAGAEQAMREIRRYKSSGKDKLKRNNKKDGARYRGLNFCPWISGRYYASSGIAAKRPKSDTTVEFRLHGNSLDADRVIPFVKLIVNLVEWSSKATGAQVRKLPKSAFRALMQISPESKDWLLAKLKEWRLAYKRKRRAIFYTAGPGWTIGRPPPPPAPIFTPITFNESQLCPEGSCSGCDENRRARQCAV